MAAELIRIGALLKLILSTWKASNSSEVPVCSFYEKNTLNNIKISGTVLDSYTYSFRLYHFIITSDPSLTYLPAERVKSIFLIEGTILERSFNASSKDCMSVCFIIFQNFRLLQILEPNDFSKWIRLLASLLIFECTSFIVCISIRHRKFHTRRIRNSSDIYGMADTIFRWSLERWITNSWRVPGSRRPESQECREKKCLRFQLNSLRTQWCRLVCCLSFAIRSQRCSCSAKSRQRTRNQWSHSISIAQSSVRYSHLSSPTHSLEYCT